MGSQRVGHNLVTEQQQQKCAYGNKQHKTEMDILKSATLEIYYNKKNPKSISSIGLFK